MSRHVYAAVFALAASLAIGACASNPLGPTPDEDATTGGQSAGAAGLSGSAGLGAGGASRGPDPSCTLGAERCDCRPDRTCDGNLLCLSNLCVDRSGFCPYAGDGYCDEPFSCPEGTDPDCCATTKDGVCEELSEGGQCPNGTDWFDCGYCPSDAVGDGVCDEPSYCPVGSDVDCCATPKDGQCEELSMGGECANGSDSFDCGYCPTFYLDDKICDEPDYCPTGSDANDCCAHFADGACEEVSQGGECQADSDWYDCGYCRESWLNDGFCDEVQQRGSCPSNSDREDCCASWADGICEEPSEGGSCPKYSDYLDCGYCPEDWVDNGFCDEVGIGRSCPAGSDGDDCCGTPRDGVCEEESMGGSCAADSDYFDCGYCPDYWVEDGFCEESALLWGCPAGTDSYDCGS